MDDYAFTWKHAISGCKMINGFCFKVEVHEKSSSNSGDYAVNICTVDNKQWSNDIQHRS